jgi:hypothetical protein
MTHLDPTRRSLAFAVLLLLPAAGSAQAPSLAEVLSAAMDYTRSDGRVGKGPWHLGIDSNEAERLGPEQAAAHRQALARLAAEREVSFHSEGDLRRVICDGNGCGYPHGKQALSFAVRETSPDRGVSVVHAHWSMIREPPRELDDTWVVDYVSVSLDLEVSRDAEGTLRVRELVGIRRHGVIPVELPLAARAGRLASPGTLPPGEEPVHGEGAAPPA